MYWEKPSVAPAVIGKAKAIGDDAVIVDFVRSLVANTTTPANALTLSGTLVAAVEDAKTRVETYDFLLALYGDNDNPAIAAQVRRLRDSRQKCLDDAGMGSEK